VSYEDDRRAARSFTEDLGGSDVVDQRGQRLGTVDRVSVGWQGVRVVLVLETPQAIKVMRGARPRVMVVPEQEPRLSPAQILALRILVAARDWVPVVNTRSEERHRTVNSQATRALVRLGMADVRDRGERLEVPGGTRLEARITKWGARVRLPTRSFGGA
jgi:sporulation protein YlmC with PRC-barrel domain